MSSRKNKTRNKAKAPQVTSPTADANDPKSLGDQSFRKKDFTKAVGFYTQAIDQEAKTEDAQELCKLYSNRSAAHHAMRDFASALHDADLIIALTPGWAKGYYRKGKALEGLLRYEDAVAALGKAVELEGDNEQYRQAARDVDYNLMIEWLLNGGAKFPKLLLQYYEEDYRGVHVSQNIPPEEIILEVPLKYIMTTEIAKESAIGKKIIQSGVNLTSQHTYLACYLLQERSRGHSFWDPYLRCLPKHYSNMPINFTPEEKAYLKGSFSLDKMAQRVESLQNEYKNLCTSVPEFADISTYDDFVWARHVVITRIFGMVIQDEIKTNGLVPMADMLNHKIPKETRWTFEKTLNSFTITSLKQLHQGDQVYDSYGRKCNHRFFVNYGFSLEENEDNEVVLKFKLADDDPLHNIKVKYLSTEERQYQIPANTDHEKTKEMLSFLRLLVASEEDVKVFGMVKDHKLDAVEPVSVSNEVKVLLAAQAAAERCLAGFDTSLEDDEKLLKEEKLTFNIRNAVLMRRGEKQVCRYFVELSKTCLPFFEMTPSEVKEALKKMKKKLKKGNLDFDHYVTTIIIPLIERKDKLIKK